MIGNSIELPNLTRLIDGLSAGPEVTPGHECNRPAELLDIYPTLVDLAVLPEVDHLEGLSLSRQLTSANAPRSRLTITSQNQGNYVIVNEQ